MSLSLDAANSGRVNARNESAPSSPRLVIDVRGDDDAKAAASRSPSEPQMFSMIMEQLERIRQTQADHDSQLSQLRRESLMNSPSSEVHLNPQNTNESRHSSSSNHEESRQRVPIIPIDEEESQMSAEEKQIEKIAEVVAKALRKSSPKTRSTPRVEVAKFNSM
jgi:hypothetical protein